MKTVATAAALGAFGLSSLAFGGAAQAQTTLSLTMAGDDTFQVSFSASPTSPGTLIGSGANWSTTYHFTTGPLKPGQTHYLRVLLHNTGGPGGLIGAFHLSSRAFRFAGGSQDLVTGPSGWSGALGGGNAAPTGPVFSEGANGAAPWGTVRGVAPAAQWIWPRAAVCVCWASFSATITPTAGPAMKRAKR
jgi:hypothetical protein